MRILLFVGPPKTASTYLYKFFNRHNDQVLVQNGWQWPACPLDEPYSFKPFASFPEALLGLDPLTRRHCRGLGDSATFLAYYELLFRNEYEEEKQSHNKNMNNIAFGSEYFTSYFAQKKYVGPLFDGLLSLMPWNHDDDREFVERTFKDDKGNELNAVIMYRTPRLSHLFSDYKQSQKETKNKIARNVTLVKSTFSEYVCQKFNSKTSLKYNPLGMAKVFLDHELPLTVVDMAGVKSAGLDVADAVVCELMDVSSCVDGRIINNDDDAGKVTKATTLTSDLMLKSERITAAVEDVFVALDCYYRGILENNPFVDIMHKQNLFANCSNSKKTLTQTQAYGLLEQIGCAATKVKSGVDEVQIERHILQLVRSALNFDDYYDEEEDRFRNNTFQLDAGKGKEWTHVKHVNYRNTTYFHEIDLKAYNVSHKLISFNLFALLVPILFYLCNRKRYLR